MLSRSIISKFFSISSLNTRNLSKLSSTSKPDICYSIANSSQNCKIFDFFEKNFIRRDPVINSLFQCGYPKVLREYFENEVNSPPENIIATNKCNNEIVGVSLNTILKKKDDNLCKFMARESDYHLKKYFQILTELFQSPKLNEKFCVDKIIRVHAVTSIDDDTSCQGMEIAKELMKKSFEMGKQQKFQYASIHCTSTDMMRAAEAMKCEKAWSSCPKPPHDSMNVYTMKLC